MGRSSKETQRIEGRCNATVTLRASVDGSRWLCAGRSRNASWVRPFCRLCGLCEKFLNAQLFGQRLIGSRLCKYTTVTLLRTPSNEIAFVIQPRENTWICQKAGYLKMEENVIIAMGNRPIQEKSGFKREAI